MGLDRVFLVPQSDNKGASRLVLPTRGIPEWCPFGFTKQFLSTTAAVRHRRWLLDCGNDSVWLASDGVFASATSVEILLFALTASMSNQPTGDALPTRSGAKGRLRIPLLSLPQAYGADEGVRQ